jgi:acetyl-CoA C-acetyltransferase
MTTSVIVAGARTPIGKFQGAFAGLSAVELGAAAIREALARSGASADQIDYVIMGQVLRAGSGQVTARQAAVGAGIPKEVPALNVDKVCLSGITSIALADQLIRAGEVDLVVAGGMESMTQAPYLMPAGRDGSRLGHTQMIDSMVHDGLWSSFRQQHMGASSDEVNAELGITREEQDAWAARSHLRANAGWESGRLIEETAPIEIPQRKGDPLVVDRDEGVRPGTTPEILARLKPSFNEDGTITAGNASQLSDGAAAVVVASQERAEQLGLRPMVEIVAHGMAAERFTYLHTVPALALQHALKKAQLDVHDLGLLEVNEAFAAVSLNVTRALGFDEELTNVNGGAVALGHPIGMSGARIVLTLAHEMRRRSVDLGGATICGGGGQGDALVLRRIA